MSPDLIAFLKAWHDWATSGAPDMEPFSRGAGLCFNARIWTGARAAPFALELPGALDRQDFPFGHSDYHNRWHKRTQHECPKRLAWVRERLVEAGQIVETLK